MKTCNKTDGNWKKYVKIAMNQVCGFREYVVCGLCDVVCGYH